jgi:hypothetical protein
MPALYCVACNGPVPGSRENCPACGGVAVDGIECGRYESPTYPDQHRMPVPRRDVPQVATTRPDEPRDAGRP